MAKDPEVEELKVRVAKVETLENRMVELEGQVTLLQRVADLETAMATLMADPRVAQMARRAGNPRLERVVKRGEKNQAPTE